MIDREPGPSRHDREAQWRDLYAGMTTEDLERALIMERAQYATTVSTTTAEQRTAGQCTCEKTGQALSPDERATASIMYEAKLFAVADSVVVIRVGRP